MNKITDTKLSKRLSKVLDQLEQTSVGKRCEKNLTSLDLKERSNSPESHTKDVENFDVLH